jgi:hypothetical protein
MSRVDATDPASFAGAFAYEHTDIPPGQTLEDWRRERAAQARAAKAARRALRQQRLRALLPLRPSIAPRRAATRRIEPAR